MRRGIGIVTNVVKKRIVDGTSKDGFDTIIDCVSIESSTQVLQKCALMLVFCVPVLD